MKFINCAQPHCKSIKTRFIFHILTLQHKHAKPQVQREENRKVWAVARLSPLAGLDPGGKFAPWRYLSISII